MPNASEQHAREIAETKECWERKPLLRAAYRHFHETIRARLINGLGLTVELGSGIGMIRRTIPNCLTTDIFPNPMVDQVENAYDLSFADGEVGNLILFDVWHHLEFPGSALIEFNRVLARGGRLILFEPAALSWLGSCVFGCFHHEPIHAKEPLQWYLPEGQDPVTLPYYAAQGNAWKFFRGGSLPDAFPGAWHFRQVDYFASLDWLAAGGFRGHQLCPSWMGLPLSLLSKLLQKAPTLFATRMLVVLEKLDSGN